MLNNLSRQIILNIFILAYKWFPLTRDMLYPSVPFVPIFYLILVPILQQILLDSYIL